MYIGNENMVHCFELLLVEVLVLIGATKLIRSSFEQHTIHSPLKHTCYKRGILGLVASGPRCWRSVTHCTIASVCIDAHLLLAFFVLLLFVSISNVLVGLIVQGHARQHTMC